MNDAELEQATREFNACLNEVVHYMNNGAEFFTVNVGAFEMQFDLAKLGKPVVKGSAEWHTESASWKETTPTRRLPTA